MNYGSISKLFPDGWMIHFRTIFFRDRTSCICPCAACDRFWTDSFTTCAVPSLVSSALLNFSQFILLVRVWDLQLCKGLWHWWRASNVVSLPLHHFLQRSQIRNLPFCAACDRFWTDSFTTCAVPSIVSSTLLFIAVNASATSTFTAFSPCRRSPIKFSQPHLSAFV